MDQRRTFTGRASVCARNEVIKQRLLFQALYFRAVASSCAQIKEETTLERLIRAQVNSAKIKNIFCVLLSHVHVYPKGAQRNIFEKFFCSECSKFGHVWRSVYGEFGAHCLNENYLHWIQIERRLIIGTFALLCMLFALPTLRTAVTTAVRTTTSAVMASSSEYSVVYVTTPSEQMAKELAQ